jgi:hypothetical protein
MATFPDRQVTYATNTSAPPFQTNLSSAAGVASQYDISNASSAAYYSPMLFAKKVLKNFYADSVFEEITNTDYQGEFKNHGDIIQIRQAPQFTARTYTKGTSLTYDSPAKDAINMVIDQAVYIATAVEDVEQVVSDIDLMNMYAEEAQNTIKVKVDTNVLLNISQNAHASNKGSTAGAISSNVDLGTDTTTAYVSIDRTNALDKIVEMQQVLAEQNLGTTDFYVVVPNWYATRLKLSDLKAADFTGDSTGVVRTGMIGSINGMKVYVSNNLPDTSTTSNSNYAVIAGAKMASSFALQLSKVDTLKMESTFGEKWRTLWVWGRKVARPEGVSTMYCRPS